MFDGRDTIEIWGKDAIDKTDDEVGEEVIEMIGKDEIAGIDGIVDIGVGSEIVGCDSDASAGILPAAAPRHNSKTAINRCFVLFIIQILLF